MCDFPHKKDCSRKSGGLVRNSLILWMLFASLTERRIPLVEHDSLMRSLWHELQKR
ncbi:hypothetical protein SAMN05518848_103166 [Paenibacillus sp. PDC88]|nr:hypothetical protein SAMN05518848_103166 [Paenibacillus sp. PDC88]